ncbi:hypothetical protein PPTG_23893 [Phytophthora nicotianae INRA-310]|uniref:Uncharacterized protein n=1 Tax=Phytophthora nicotianae (strain INRA-310) TaxID=761204 RepID=W2PRF6_PHYN3|nr:hypothetical protein PPTG_23893 [Phytophthora nicotianae INRA-310]ETN02784.1 hypothetical protein PPTG_23893 [Phytophthora nicotianae INRA-310]
MRSGHIKVAFFSRWKEFIVRKRKYRQNNAARVVQMKNFRFRQLHDCKCTL